MAEKYDAEILPVRDEPGSPGHEHEDILQDDDQLAIDTFRKNTEYIWVSVSRFLTNLPYDEIFGERRKFCGCVKSIIEAYEVKIHEVKALQYVIRVWKKKAQGRRKEIIQLKRANAELTKRLASSVCEDCGKEGITQQFDSLSVKETPEGISEIDGSGAEGNIATNRKNTPQEGEDDDELDASLFERQDSTNQSYSIYKCKEASCGFVALFYMFYQMRIHFCPFKFSQMIGAAATRYKGPNCTGILNNVKDNKGSFLKNIYYTKKKIDKGQYQEVLKEAEDEFKKQKQKVGILCYSTESCNHCVNINKSKDGKMKIYDANSGKNEIENWKKVRYLEINILKCDEIIGILVPHIVQRWYKCNAKYCEKERKNHSKPGKIKPSDSKEVSKEANRDL